jgi:hypothetical protein
MITDTVRVQAKAENKKEKKWVLKKISM